MGNGQHNRDPSCGLMAFAHMACEPERFKSRVILVGMQDERAYLLKAIARNFINCKSGCHSSNEQAKFQVNLEQGGE